MQAAEVREMLSVYLGSEHVSAWNLQEDDQRLKTLSGRTVEHILALLPARIGNTPRDASAQLNGGAFELTGADVRMSAASAIANLSQSLANRYHKSHAVQRNQSSGGLQCSLSLRIIVASWGDKMRLWHHVGQS